jgi:hypothetical protein
LGQVQQASRLQQVGAGWSRRNLPVEAAVVQFALGGVGLTALDERLDEQAERERHP